MASSYMAGLPCSPAVRFGKCIVITARSGRVAGAVLSDLRRTMRLLVRSIVVEVGMALQTSSVASFNELSGYFRQRQAAEEGDRWYGGSWYEGGIDQWIQWPEWLNSRCDDRYSALDAGGCCRDSRNAAVCLALHLSDMAQDMLAALDGGVRGCTA